MASPSWGFWGGPGSIAYRLFDVLRARINDRLVSWLAVQAVPERKTRGVRILEAGSGPAGGSSAFRRRFPEGIVVALDIDLDALREARHRDPGLPAVVGDIHRLPFADDVFDLVWNSSTVEHLPAIEPALGEMARVAAPDGYTFVGVPYRWGPLGFQPLIRSTALGRWLGEVWSGPELGRRLQAAGLSVTAKSSYFFRFFVGLLARKSAADRGDRSPSGHPTVMTAAPDVALPPIKKAAFWTITVVIVLIVPEMALRVYLASQYGSRLLLYGTRWSHFSREFGALDPALPTLEVRREARTVRNHELLGEGFEENPRDGYSKYFPNQVKSDVDEDFRKFDVTINSHGFRGRDYADRKSPETVRIVTLGASSTFGYHNRDDETYPVYLEDYLNRAGGARQRYEVINLGIPHLRSARIHNLFIHEALKLDPDVITFYEGYNDATAALKGEVRGEGAVHDAIGDIGERAKEHSLVIALLADSMAVGAARWRSPESLDRMSREAAREVIANLDRIAEECRKRGIIFVMSTQQSRSLSVDAERIRGLSFEREVALLTDERPEIKAGVNPKLTYWDVAFLVHYAVNREIRRWAAEKNVPLVDLVALLDGRRDLLLSWVHLKPEANRLVAQGLGDKILELLGQSADPARARSPEWEAIR